MVMVWITFQIKKMYLVTKQFLLLVALSATWNGILNGKPLVECLPCFPLLHLIINSTHSGEPPCFLQVLVRWVKSLQEETDRGMPRDIHILESLCLYTSFPLLLQNLTSSSSSNMIPQSSCKQESCCYTWDEHGLLIKDSLAQERVKEHSGNRQ